MNLSTPLVRPQIVLFDWDNTLVDTWPVITRALNATLSYMGHEPWSLERVKRDVKRSMRDSFPEMFGDRWGEAAERYQSDYRAVHLQDLTPLAGAEALLNSLLEHKLFLALVSNKRGPSLRTEMVHLGWEKYFNAAVGAQDAQHDKPHADPAKLAMKEAPIMQGKSIWFIGDTGVDLECAMNIGATAVLYGEHDTDGKTHDGFAYDVHVRNHAELQTLFATALSQK